MNNTFTLPENHKPLLSIDLQQNKKLALLVNGLAVVISLIMLAIGWFITPFTLNFEGSFAVQILLLLADIVAIIAYMFIHEWIHGIFIKKFSKKKAFYGFTGLYAYAGSECYFNKKSYLIIALAPVVICGIFFTILNFILPISLFWYVYLLQLINISGAAGDIYVTIKFCRLPSDILVKDSGISMEVFSAK